MLKQAGDEDAAAWEVLRTMAGPGRSITPDIAERWLAALVLIRNGDARFVPVRGAMERVLDHSALGKGFPTIDPRNPPVFPSSTAAGCPPFGPPPAGYGAALPTK